MTSAAHVLLTIAFDGLAYAMVLFVISAGLSVTMGMMGVINLAHGAFAAIGGYATVWLTAQAGLPFPLALLLAGALAAVLAVPAERWCYRPVYKADHLAHVLLSIGISLVVVAALTWLFGPSSHTIRMPDYLSGNVELLGVVVPVYRAAVIAVGLAFALALWLAIDKTTIGARIRAAVDNRDMAESVGIDVDRLFSITFALGCALAAIGGGLAVNILGVGPRFGLQYLVYFLVIVVVGGMGSVKGAFASALVIGVGENAGRYFLPQAGAFFMYGIAVVLLLVRPNGFFTRASTP
ncbi:branched-chain amino acid ABC transporter permease [Arenibaculum sp.]|uniref:branched-chain amino acid ABC transporter permease n=1 Tax=Arenibaculum sp. TaxID=2865862 RepID=UPI002E0E0AE1|nr:branched-chain amino acid ABC transporter permease [Arenibaculum sp.]